MTGFTFSAVPNGLIEGTAQVANGGDFGEGFSKGVFDTGSKVTKTAAGEIVKGKHKDRLDREE